MRICSWSMLWLWLTIAPVCAGVLSTQDVEQAADTFLLASKAAGVEIAVALPGSSDPVLVARGFSCVPHKVPLLVNDPMRIGSITKLFTALRIKMYIDAGTLSYETPLSKFYPDVRGGDKITICHLLNHTAGLRELQDIPEILANPTKTWAIKDLLAVILKAEPSFAAGEQMRYSNSSYIVLGDIIARLSGKTWECENNDAIAAPLKMKICRLGDDVTVLPGEAHGYALGADGTWCKPISLSNSFAYSAGGLVCGAMDLLRLATADTLLKKPWLTLEKLTPVLLNNGKPTTKHVDFRGIVYDWVAQDGLEQLDFPDGLRLIGKQGNYPGFTSMFARDPATGMVIAVLVNQEKVNQEIIAMIRRLCAIIHKAS